MNPPTDRPADPQAIRAQINTTRQRMDQTIDALGARFTSRHLVDEALHYFRTQNENGNMKKIKQKVSTSANAAVHSVVDTVKANPIPAALIGAGVAWYIYNQTRRPAGNGQASSPDDGSTEYDESYAREASDFGISLGEGPGIAEGLKEKAGQIQERSKEALHAAGTRIHEVGEQVRERAQEVGQRARQGVANLGNRSRQLYQEGRQRVASTVEQRPLESGLVCLALGLVAGLALPTSPRVRQTVAPRVRQLRQRTEEMAGRGRVVLNRAAEAAKSEAQAQGLMPSSSAGDDSPAANGEAGPGTPVPEGMAGTSAPMDITAR